MQIGSWQVTHGGRLRVACLAALLPLALAGGAARAQAQQAGTYDVEKEKEAALAVMQRLFVGMRTRDTAAIRAVFEPNARLVGMRTRPDGTSVLQAITPAQFADFVIRDTRGTWRERGFNPQVRVEGTLATVWIEYDFHLGEKFSHCGVDAAQLLKVSGEWKIVSLADTYQPQGCPPRPPVSDG